MHQIAFIGQATPGYTAGGAHSAPHPSPDPLAVLVSRG